MTSFPMTESRPHFPAPAKTPVVVQILGMILFAGFAIPVTIIALDEFWPAGVILAIVLGWRGTFAFGQGRGPSAADMAQMMQSLKPETATPKASSNASFNAYRSDMLTRLEVEQENFESFLDRLRDAKDKAQFDTYMDERARNKYDAD